MFSFAIFFISGKYKLMYNSLFQIDFERLFVVFHIQRARGACGKLGGCDHLKLVKATAGLPIS